MFVTWKVVQNIGHESSCCSRDLATPVAFLRKSGASASSLVLRSSGLHDAITKRFHGVAEKTFRTANAVHRLPTRRRYPRRPRWTWGRLGHPYRFGPSRDRPISRRYRGCGGPGRTQWSLRLRSVLTNNSLERQMTDHPTHHNRLRG
jgi:hypothetical protein